MITHASTPGNTKKLAQLQAAMTELLAEATRRGFFGVVALEMNVQDGTIQSIRRKLERIER